LSTPGESLVETPQNPIPAGARIHRIETSDGVPLRVASWLPTGPSARGTIILMQGRAEFIEKYAETIGDLLRRGFAVVAFDWRGQGGSGRSTSDPTKGHVEDFALYRRDIEAVELQIPALNMPKPVFGLAHSMGGCIALTGAREGWLPVQRLVALAPMVELKLVKHPRAVRAIIHILARLGLGRSFVPGGNSRSISTLPFIGNRLSSDPARYARNAALAAAVGPAAIGAPTVGWLHAAYRAMARCREPGFAAAIDIPTLVVAAGEDPVCATPAITAFAEGLRTGPALVIPDARHEILMENDAIRAAFWAAFDAFLAEDEPARSAAQAIEDDRVQARVAAGDD
jgi:lysophospholipase